MLWSGWKLLGFRKMRFLKVFLASIDTDIYIAEFLGTFSLNSCRCVLNVTDVPEQLTLPNGLATADYHNTAPHAVL
jgi:hypothetical protein